MSTAEIYTGSHGPHTDPAPHEVVTERVAFLDAFRAQPSRPPEAKLVANLAAYLMEDNLGEHRIQGTEASLSRNDAETLMHDAFDAALRPPSLKERIALRYQDARKKAAEKLDDVCNNRIVRGVGSVVAAGAISILASTTVTGDDKPTLRSEPVAMELTADKTRTSYQPERPAESYMQRIDLASSKPIQLPLGEYENTAQFTLEENDTVYSAYTRYLAEMGQSADGAMDDLRGAVTEAQAAGLDVFILNGDDEDDGNDIIAAETAAGTIVFDTESVLDALSPHLARTPVTHILP